MMNRFLERLSYSNYKNNFIIKGGVLITSMAGVALRSTMDIDTSIKNISLDTDNIVKIIEEILNINMDDGITFSIKSTEKIMDNFEYPGIRININATIENMITPFNIDISTNDIITPKEINYKYNLIFEKRTIDLLAYNLETIIAEKLQTIMSRGVLNTRMRDFYDLFIIMNLYQKNIKIDVLKNAFEATSKKRNSEYGDLKLVIQDIATSEYILNLWNRYRNKYEYASTIEFDKAIAVIRNLIEIIE